LISLPDLSFEEAHEGIVCGVDEVGRGPLAGPLVAAAVILDRAAIPEGIRDSKSLTKKRLAIIAPLIEQSADSGIGVVPAEELDEIGLTAANDLAMARAIAALGARPTLALTDGKRLPRGMPCPAQAIVKGDAKSLSIAAASIVAKVHRDAIMRDLAVAYPGYGWETNAGYPTLAHRKALKTLGITREHRRSFAPVARYYINETV
jgi:ribonuclease HII